MKFSTYSLDGHMVLMHPLETLEIQILIFKKIGLLAKKLSH